MQQITVGFIGAGGNARQMHLRDFKTGERKLSAVANRSVESSRETARKFGIHRVCEDWRQIVEDPSMEQFVSALGPICMRRRVLLHWSREACTL